ncbi:MAG: hypothetical protein U0232_30765 [Thermomicrobiales bacterium]
MSVTVPPVRSMPVPLLAMVALVSLTVPAATDIPRMVLLASVTFASVALPLWMKMPLELLPAVAFVSVATPPETCRPMLLLLKVRLFSVAVELLLTRNRDCGPG